jgi:hypothetical protein
MIFAVLHTDKINSPLAAVRGAIVAEHRSKASTISAASYCGAWRQNSGSFGLLVFCFLAEA